MTDIPDLIKTHEDSCLCGEQFYGRPCLFCESAQALRDLQAELSVWKPNTASEGHCCPACGREYTLEEKLQAKVEQLEAENKRLKLALQNNLHEALYQKQVKALQAKVEQLEGALRTMGIDPDKVLASDKGDE